MSEFLGQAFVRIRPDTTTFATELKADVVAAAAAASASATSSAKSASAAAKEAGVSVRYLATATTALTQAQNANARAAKAAALAVSEITGVTGRLAIAQERAARASALTLVADKAVQKSKAAVIAAEKTYAHAVATGEAAVVASMEKSLLAARGAYALSEANLTAAASHEAKAKAAITDAKAEQAAAAASTSSLKGNVAAAAAAAARTSRGVASPATGAEVGVAASTKQAAADLKATATKNQLTRANNLNSIAAAKNVFVTREIVNVTSALGIAQIRASRASEAAIFAEDALTKVKLTGVAVTIDAAEANLLKAQTLEKDTAATLRNIKAQTVHSSQLAFARRGALASVLSMVGLRGATLAANSAFIAGAAGLLVFAKSLAVATRFETQLNVFRVIAGATAEEMERVSERAVQLGADFTLPGVSAGDAAEAMTELAKAGLSAQDALEGARGVLQLATAANISNADATALAASALNAFGLAGDQAVRVADVLANAANAAQGSIQDMGFSLQQAAAVGRQVGLSLEDTTVFLTSLTRAGLRGSDAGTSLRTSLLRLINPTKKIQAVFAELGLSLRDAEGNFRTDFFVNLGLALEGLSKKQRDAKIAVLGGADAIRALSILSRQSIEDLIGLRNQIREQGTAAEVASARTSGLAGAGKALQNTLENVGLAIGQSVTPGLTAFAHNLNTAIAAISASASVRETLGDSLALIGDGFQALGFVLTTVGPPLLGLAGIFQQTISAIGVAEILGAVAAYKLLPVILGAVKSAYASLYIQVLLVDGAMKKQMATAGATGALGALRVGLRAAATSFAAFATSATGIGIAVAALAGGLIYLATRESSAERATRHLKDASDALQGSLSALASVTDNLARANSSLASEELSVQSAQLAAAQARQSLTNSDAAKGSLERRQLENALSIALDNVRLAEQRLLETRKEQIQLAAEQRQAEINLTADKVKQAASINEVIGAIEREVQAKQLHTRGLNTEQQAVRFAKLEADSIDELTKKLNERADAEAAVNTEASRAVAERLRLIANVAQATDQLPSEHAIEILVEAPNVKSALTQVAAEFGISGKEAVAAFVASFTTDLPKATQQLAFAIGDLLVTVKESFGGGGHSSQDAFWRAFLAGTAANKEKVANAIVDVISRSNAKIAALDREALDLEIAGASPQSMLANLQAKKAEQERVVARQERRFGRGNIAIDQVTAAKEKLRDTVDKIRALEKSIAGDAESAKREIEQARDKADQAVIDAFAGKRTRLENLLVRAQGTEGVGDDIKFNKALVAILKNQIKLAGDRIKNLEKRRDFIRDTNKLILTITNQIKGDQQKQKDLLREQRQDRQQEREDRINANIEFASINENVRGEIRARQARIRFLQAQQRQILKEKGQRAKNTAAYLDLRNEIAREKKAIKDLRGEQEGLNNEAQKMIFEFLQTQQGFAANLLGNLIPAGVTGLTGSGGGGGALLSAGPGAGGSAAAGFGGGLGGALIAEAGLAEAGKAKGPSSGQFSELIEVNRAMLQMLARIAGDVKHPEAKRSKISVRAALDMLN